MTRTPSRLVVVLAFMLAGMAVYGASEERTFRVASNALALKLWDNAETNFARFVAEFPGSSRVPEAILYQGQARFHLQRYDRAIELLTASQAKAGWWEDEYLFWIGRAQFGQTNYAAAADAFARIIEKFPVSPLRLEACVREAQARAQLLEWSRVIELLDRRDGVFQAAVRSGNTNETVAAGYLLLGEARLAQADEPAGVQAALQALERMPLNPDLTWRREHLRCRLLVAQGALDEAMRNSTNLLALADAARNPLWHAEGIAFQGSLFERLTKYDEAIAAYQRNLTNAPVDQQRQALLKIADLSLAQNKPGAAIRTLEIFYREYSNAPAADLALLTIGELQLKQILAAQTNGTAPANGKTADANAIAPALASFDLFLATFSNSPLTGRALLDKGWCLWSAKQYPPSAGVFQAAAEALPFSADQAVARFKWGDALLMLGDYHGAVTQYQFIVTQYAADAGIRDRLFELALYQTARAALATNDLAAASAALQALLDSYPDGFAGPECLLLAGQAAVQRDQPARARELFTEFEKRYPGHPLLPQLRLARARSYEQELDWRSAAVTYADWVNTFTNRPELPQAEFSRAWTTFMAGDETNALILFTNLVARFPTNEVNRQAQWWIGDYYFRQGALGMEGGFQKAEIHYQLVAQNTNLPASDLTYHAIMMAGRAAVARLSYRDAISYFTNLAANPKCPLELRIQATFGYADALASRTDAGATNWASDIEEAIGWFSTIPQTYPTNSLAPLAWGNIGHCWFQLGELNPKYYERASNAYQQVINWPGAPAKARSEARIGLGKIAEKVALKKTGSEQSALLALALNYYVDVFFQLDLREGEQCDPFWVKKAGMEAGTLAEHLQQWVQATNIYHQMKTWLPPLASTFDARILKVQEKIGKTPPAAP